MNLDQILAVVAAVIGWVVLGLVASYSIPQFVKVIKTKNTSSLSIISFSAFVISNALMASWGIGNALRNIEVGKPILFICITLIPNILTNTLNLTINLSTLLIKINHVKLAKKNNITELQLATKLLEAKKGKVK